MPDPKRSDAEPAGAADDVKDATAPNDLPERKVESPDADSVKGGTDYSFRQAWPTKVQGPG